MHLVSEVRIRVCQFLRKWMSKIYGAPGRQPSSGDRAPSQTTLSSFRAELVFQFFLPFCIFFFLFSSGIPRPVAHLTRDLLNP